MTAPKAMGANYWREIAGRNRSDISEAYRDRLICPDDDAPLEPRAGSDEFFCTGCGRVFSFRNSILELLPSDDPYRVTEEQITVLSAANSTATKGSEEVVRAAVRRLGPLEGRRALDLGCGRGEAALALAAGGAIVAAVDVDGGAGGLEALSTSRPEGARIDLFQGDGCRLPFASETFDIIHLGNVISILPRPERIMREVARVLAPTGLVVNGGEPIGGGGISLGAGAGDPRRSGRGLTLADYRAIYVEAGLEMTAENLDGAPLQKPGLLGRLTGGNRVEGPLLFVARHQPGFQLPSLGIPWKKKETKP